MEAFLAQEAVNLFIESYVHLESAVLPGTKLIRVGGLPCVQFPDRQGKISHEIITHGVSPAEIAARIQASSPGLPHWLTLLTSTPQDDLPALERSGYRLRTSEMMMIRSIELANLPAADARVQQVCEPAQVKAINKSRGRRLLHPDELADPRMHICGFELDGRIRAWGNSLMIREDTTYIANMFTLSKFRRQGLARAVLSTLLAASAAQGARRSLLVSSQTGMALYRGMGYQDFLACLVFDVM